MEHVLTGISLIALRDQQVGLVDEHDIGFTSEEVETYMRLLLEQRGTGKKRLRMLEQKRKAALDEIHFRERQVARMDGLRHRLLQEQQSTEEAER